MAGWIRSYERAWLKGDLIAGVAVAALIVPKNLGYAGIAQFLSRAVVTGFLFGAAIDVVIGELPKLAPQVPGLHLLGDHASTIAVAAVALVLIGFSQTAGDARVKPAVRELLERDGVLDRIGNGNIHGNIDQAVEAQTAARGDSRADA